MEDYSPVLADSSEEGRLTVYNANDGSHKVAVHAVV